MFNIDLFLSSLCAGEYFILLLPGTTTFVCLRNRICFFKKEFIEGQITSATWFNYVLHLWLSAGHGSGSAGMKKNDKTKIIFEFAFVPLTETF